jgi:serine/threonine protein kinase
LTLILYSLACVAYRLLSGELVFDADTPIAMLMHHVSETPKPLSKRVTTELPGRLVDVIERCLRKDRGNRPRDALEVLAELEAVPFDRPWTNDRARDWSVENVDGDPQPAGGTATSPGLE